MKADAKSVRNFRTLQRVTSFVSHIANLGKLLTAIMEESKTILDAEASSLLLYNKEEKVLFFEVATGAKGNLVKQIKLKMGQGIAGVCAKERRVINVKDVTREKHFFAGADKQSKFKTRAILAMPLVRKNRLLGVLEVLNKKNGSFFTDEDVSMMEIIATQAALAIENAYLFRDNLRKANLAGIGQTMICLSHNTKNILNGLMGGITLVDEGMKSSDGDLTGTGWRMVKQNVERISDLILDMLNFSSKKKPLYQKTKVNPFLKGIGSIYEERIKEKECRMEYDFDDRITEVELDNQGLQRALLNLLTNAVEAIPPKTGCITLRTRLLPDNRMFQIAVQDNGCGIPPENLKKIFDLFFTTKGHKGTGLGLSVVKKIIKEHNGKLDVTSRPGEGTCFTLTFPVNASHDSPRAPSR